MILIMGEENRLEGYLYKRKEKQLSTVEGERERINCLTVPKN